MNLGEMMKSERLKQGLSRNKLAEMADVSKSSIVYWENGERNMTVDNADRVFKALNISVTLGRQEEAE